MLGRVFSLVAALLLASANAQASAPARSIAHQGALASPAKTAPREIFAVDQPASGKNPLASVCRVGEKWHPPQNLTSGAALYDWAGGRVLRTRRTNLTSYAQHDALKSPTRWSRADGGELARATYDAWGNASQQSGTLPPIGYTGYYADAESSLYYAQQRYYSPKLGRFTRVDPWAGDVLNPITLNKYLYGAANPLRYIDPDGREIWDAQTQRLNQLAYETDPARAAQVRRDYAEEDVRGTARLHSTWQSGVDTVKGMFQLALTLGQASVENRTGGLIDYGARKKLGHAGSEMLTTARHPIDRIYSPIKAKFARADAMDAEYRRTGNVQTLYDAEYTRHDATLETTGVVTSAAGAPSIVRSGGRMLAKTLSKGADSAPIGAPRTSVIGEGADGGPAVQILQEPGRAPQVRGGAGPVRVGQYGESVGTQVTGLPKNTQRIPSASGKREYRVPDHMDNSGHYIAEDKAVRRQFLSSQLLDDKAYVLRGNMPGRVDVNIDTSTEITRPLLREHLNPASPIKLRGLPLRRPDEQ